MKKNGQIKLFIIILIFTMIETFYPAGEYPNLIPKPEKIELSEGVFILSNETVIESDESLDHLKKYFLERINIFTGLTPGLNKNDGTTIIFKLDNLPVENEEAYSISVSKKNVEIKAATEQGIFYAMQTFFQLIHPSVKANKKNNLVEIPCCSILDKPMFSWRGLNLDCSRHFMSKDFIKRYIDILAYYKFNTFHWHLTEDQGWRIEIKKYPKLTKIGAWRKEADGSIYGGYYTQEDIKEIVAYAQSRFINVVPEIEMPGHSLASLASYPENSCTGGPFEVTNMWGVLKDVYCAGRDSTFFFLQDILDEVITLFPGEYIHIGGDECPKERWKNCPKCQARIKTEGLKDEHELQSYFIKRISTYLNSKGKKVIGWDEILQGGLAPGAIVQSWQSFQGAIDAAKLGHKVICSPASHTYLNSDPENLDLRIAYSFNPIPEGLSAEEAKFVIGAEANLWTERAPQETVDSKLFPRILALAEVFWSNPEKNYDEFYSRVQKTYNDLSALGIQYGLESKVINYSTTYDELNKEFIVNVTSVNDDLKIRYTTDGSEPNENSEIYTNPFKINKTSEVKIAAFRNGYFAGKKIILNFDFHEALNSKITLKNQYDERYRANGENGLIDGIRGSKNFHEGSWQGYEGVDFEAIIDLGKEKEISKVIPRFLLDSNSWIFLPLNVRISVSKDNVNFSEEKFIENDIPQKNSEFILKDFTADFNQTARYIKVKTESIKECPDWHPSAGGKAWLFIDEIVVE